MFRDKNHRKFLVMNHSDRKRVQETKRLMYAVHSMSLVIDACRIALTNPNANLDFSNIIGASICTLYASPFTEGNGLGALSSTYTKFPAKEQEGIHSDLIKARHQVYSHRDLVAELNDIHKIIVVVQPNKEIHVHTPVAGYTWTDYPRIIALCEFQKNRMELAAQDLIFTLQKRHKKPVGEYVLGVSFP